jgi:NAD(P)-dependent dehydrogenase (short-subunit alcohol dehydrogenase family)
VINVSAVEGQFNVPNKSARHVQSNMAKAALNMLTRTSGTDYLQRHGISMNAVDTGWITNWIPPTPTEKHTYYPPLDSVDGAARILDPIAQTMRDPAQVTSGLFYKNFLVTEW